MKKIALCVFVLVIGVMLVACSNGNNNGDLNGNPDNTTPPAGGDIPVPDVFSFTYKDVIIELNSNISDILGALGEPSSILESPSCAFDGIDRIYSYPGIQIYTYPVGDDDFIHTIGFFTDAVSTTEGKIFLGNNSQAVIDAYGPDHTYETGMYRYTRGKTVLEFLVEDDIVIGITYRYLLDL